MNRNAVFKKGDKNYALLSAPPIVDGCQDKSDVAVFIPVYDWDGWKKENEVAASTYYLRHALWARYFLYKWTDAITENVRVYFLTTPDIVDRNRTILRESGVSVDTDICFIQEKDRFPEEGKFHVKLLAFDDPFIRTHEIACLMDSDCFVTRPEGAELSPIFQKIKELDRTGIYSRCAGSEPFWTKIYRYITNLHNTKETNSQNRERWEKIAKQLTNYRMGDVLLRVHGSTFLVFPKSHGYSNFVDALNELKYKVLEQHDEIVVGLSILCKNIELNDLAPIFRNCNLKINHGPVLIEEETGFYEKNNY